MCRASGKIKAMVSTVMYKIIDGFHFSSLSPPPSFPTDYGAAQLSRVIFIGPTWQQQPRKRKFQSKFFAVVCWICNFLAVKHIWCFPSFSSSERKKREKNEIVTNALAICFNIHDMPLLNLVSTCIAWKWMCCAARTSFSIHNGYHKKRPTGKNPRICFRFN